MVHCSLVFHPLESMDLPFLEYSPLEYSQPTTTARCTAMIKPPQVGGFWFHPQRQLHGLRSVKCTTYMSKAMYFTLEPIMAFIALTSIHTFQVNNLLWLKMYCTATPSPKSKRLGINSCLRHLTRGLLASTITLAFGSRLGILTIPFPLTQCMEWHRTKTSSTSYQATNSFVMTQRRPRFHLRLRSTKSTSANPHRLL